MYMSDLKTLYTRKLNDITLGFIHFATTEEVKGGVKRARKVTGTGAKNVNMILASSHCLRFSRIWRTK